MAFNIILRKEHLTPEGFQEILKIRAVMSKGLPDSFKEAYPNIISIERPTIKDQKIKDPNWVSGFVSGESNFFINISKSKTHKLGNSVRLRFSISQHSRDTMLLRSLIDYFGCGNIHLYSSRDVVNF